MCLSTVYELGAGGSSRMLAEYVRDLTVSGDTITLTDIMGKEMTVQGVLQRVDLVKNAILISGQRQKAAQELRPEGIL